MTTRPVRIGDHTYFGDIVLPDLKVDVYKRQLPGPSKRTGVRSIIEGTIIAR